ncbi:MAG: spore coat protein U domain-containing protein [Deltaproteobacteria bacterium]|nr:spore coat protein U domain-containing protein [Deltaproteobacteria bacterium]
MKKILLTVFAFVIVSFMASTNANALTATTSLNVVATVDPSCTVDTALVLIDFGVYNPAELVTPLDTAAPASFSWSCTKGTTYDVYITGARDMTGLIAVPDTLLYELYTDTSGGTVFPSAAGGITGTAVSNVAVTTDIHGRIAAGQDVSVDNYSSANGPSADPVITILY